MKCRKPNHFAKICRSTGVRRDETHQKQRQPALRQVWVKSERWEKDQIGDMPPLEDIEDNGVFVILCAGDNDGKTMPPLVGRVEIEGVKTNGLIATWATVNVIDMTTFRKITT